MLRCKISSENAILKRQILEKLKIQYFRGRRQINGYLVNKISQEKENVFLAQSYIENRKESKTKYYY